MQLNLFEFINFLVRVAFWRCNPQWGSKYNKKDLTPVPESTQILLEECILPKAKRDTSGEFKKVLPGGPGDAGGARRVPREAAELAAPHPAQGAPHRQPQPADDVQDVGGAHGRPRPRRRREVRGAKPPCPKMVGEWFLAQESQITGDERTSRKNQITFKAKLSIPQCRWNFLRSQTIEQVEGGDVDAEQSDVGHARLRRAGRVHRALRRQHVRAPDDDLPAVAQPQGDDDGRRVRSWLQNLLFEKSPEMCMWEATVIKADRYDWQKQTKMLPGFSPAQHKLWCQCWENIVLLDIHHFPLWEKGVHDTLQQHFPVLMRIFSHYTKGISGIDSAADALEMELEEFHDFVKDAKIETRMINFTTMTNVFAKANATNTAEAFEQRMRERRNAQVQGELEERRARTRRNTAITPKKGDYARPLRDRSTRTPEPGSMKVKKPDNRLTLTEFLGCLVRISFLRANPKHGQYDNKAKLVELPGCLKKMLEEVVIPNAKQDMSSLFREEIAQDAEVQAVFDEYREKLTYYYTEVNLLTALKGKADNKLSMETWMDIAAATCTSAKRKGCKHMEKAKIHRQGGRGAAASARAPSWATAPSCARATSRATSAARRSSRAASRRSRPSTPSSTRSRSSRWPRATPATTTPWRRSTLTSSSSAWRAARATSTARSS